MAPEMWDGSGHDQAVEWWLASLLMKGQVSHASQHLVQSELSSGLQRQCPKTVPRLSSCFDAM